MKRNEAIEIFKGKHFPFGKASYKEDDFVIVGLDSSVFTTRIIDEKAVKNPKHEPAFVTFGRKHKDGVVRPYWNKKPQIHDGNHRIEAAKRKGESVLVCIPECQLKCYEVYYATNLD